MEALLNDIKDFIIDGDNLVKKQSTNNKENRIDDKQKIAPRVYCMQPFAVASDKENVYVVEDGQQRLTTFYLLIKYLFGSNEKIYTFSFESDTDNKRKNFLENKVDIEDYKK